MTWIQPHVWAVGEEITAQLLNQTGDNSLAILHPYDYVASDVTITNNNTEQTLYSKVITGGAMGTNGLLLLELFGDFNYANATSDTINVRVKFGGSTLLAGTFTPNGGNLTVTDVGWVLRTWIFNRGSASAQFVIGQIETSTTGGAGGQTSLGNWLQKFTRVAHARPTIDTSSDQSLIATVQWSAASTNLSWRRRVAQLRLAQN